MVSGLRAKTRKGRSVQVDYLIHIEEIKPWPPSQSLKTVRAILIQWEHGEKKGSTSSVVPSLGSGAGDGTVEFNESFKLPVTLFKEISVKGGSGDTFQKNCIEFNLYEPRRDKAVKGQLLGTAIVDFAEFGVVKESLNITAPINCTRTYRNTVQPLLFLKIQKFERGRVSSSSRDILTREASIDRKSVSTSMSEECAEEAEVASFSDDDDGSSHSSVAVASSANGSNCGSLQQGEDGAEGVKSSPGRDEEGKILHSKKKSTDLEENQGVKSLSRASPSRSSTDLSSDLAWLSRKIGGSGVNKSSTSNENGTIENTQNPDLITKHVESVQQTETVLVNSENGGEISTQQNSEISEDASTPVVNRLHEDAGAVFAENICIEGEINEKYQEDVQESGACNGENYQANEHVNEIVKEEGQSKDGPMNSVPPEDAINNESEESVVSAHTDSYGAKSSDLNNERLKHVKSVRSSAEPNRVNGSVKSNQLSAQDTQISARGILDERKDQKVHPTDTTKILLESKIHELEQRVKMAERELREAAAIEAGLYSVVAEHGSSINKVHAPARRLSRFYFHACKEDSSLKRGAAAKSAVSGLILVARACGNDVSRLTFWLSNSVVLRATVTKFRQHVPLSTETKLGKAVTGGEKKISSPLKWESFSSNGSTEDFCETFGNWEDPLTFTRALRRTEAWIFSRIVESIWWQTLTPHMQSGAAKAIREHMNSSISKVFRRTASSDHEERGSFSSELWKKAFKDACERICPVRAGGHDCGCLHFLSKLIMEQCVARLDVAMFNAILRESADEIPTDPISDPISEADVLPIPAGTASFGAGARLKNTIGNWSRFLTDLFGIDDGESQDVKAADNNEDGASNKFATSAKSFYLLNALSDLMMLPKDMLLSRTIRKEVCPAFGPLLIRRVLNIFVPDEFCSDPIPQVVLDALHSEDSFDAEEGFFTNYPCAAAPVVYIPPPISLVTVMLGDVSSYSKMTRSGSSLLKKSYTSDEELEQLDSPLSVIINDGIEGAESFTKPNWVPKRSGRQRYQLLREVWTNSE